MAKINPFKPNSPVAPEMFVGRRMEIEYLESCLLQTRAGEPSNFIITGERGIGKSSFLNYIKSVATGYKSIEGHKMHFLVIDIDIDQNTTQLGLVRKIELGLRKELEKSEPTKHLLKDVWKFLKNIEAAGFAFKSSNENEISETILDEFSYTLREIVKRICTDKISNNIFRAKYDGVIILVDEADNSSRSLNLGTFFKLLIERLQRRLCMQVMVGLAGLPHIKSILYESHPSSLRLFHEITLERLSERDIIEVIETCITKANITNDRVTGINGDAQDDLVSFSEGYPHFIQQFGYSAFAVDTDDIIGKDDVWEGAFGRLGALEQIGDRYYRDSFYNKIQKDGYRQVLSIMANHFDAWVTKDIIKKDFKGTDSTLGNAIKALRDRNIILSKEGERGVYRLYHKGFALWIKMKTMSRQDLRLLLENKSAQSEDIDENIYNI